VTKCQSVTPDTGKDGLRPLLGQTEVIDNRAGAAGNIAGETVARAAPDGHTFLIASATLVVNPSLPVANLAEFIALVKSGYKANCGTAGHGSSQHLGAALFNNMVAGNMVPVNYKDAGVRLD
jgi:tripartite-type tricarboxylate transporter receptor subunit TctC